MGVPYGCKQTLLFILGFFRILLDDAELWDKIYLDAEAFLLLK